VAKEVAGHQKLFWDSNGRASLSIMTIKCIMKNATDTPATNGHAGQPLLHLLSSRNFLMERTKLFDGV